MVGGGWKISLLLNSSNFCRALLALLPSSYLIPSAGQRCESLVTSAVSRKEWGNGRRRQNHSADAPAQAPCYIPGSLGGLGGLVRVRTADTVGAVEYADTVHCAAG